VEYSGRSEESVPVMPQADVLASPASTPIPRWLVLADTLCVVVLNLGLVAEVAIVFLNTVARSFHWTLMPGVDETARLLLIWLAFLGGAVAYQRGQFMAINYFVDRLPPPLRSALAAAVNWMVILVAAIIGGATIPLQITNSGEATTLLGIGYLWLTMPMTLGCGLLILHAAFALSRRGASAVVASGLPLAALVAAFILGREGAWVDTDALYWVLAAVFVGQIVMGVPVGFVLASVGILYVYSTGAAPMIAVATNAQRGTGGFIFLALPFFILAGFVMDRGGIGTRIVEFLTALIGHLRGGLLQVTIVAMYIASGISGSKAADMAAVGIPLNESCRRQGYDPGEAAAVLAASAAMGESIPPSIAILALGSVTSISTGALFLAGLLPAAFIAACLMAMVYVRARRSGRQPGTRASAAASLAAGRRAVLPLLMPVVLIGGIVGGIGTPTEISSFAVVYGLVLGVVLYREMGWRALWAVATDTSLLSGMIFFTFSGATLFSWALSLEGVPDVVASALGALGANLFLPAVILITIVLGAVLESIVTVIILGPLLLPVALILGVHPLQFGIVLIEAFGVGSIVPPVGLALYIACAICRTDVERTIRPLIANFVVLCIGLLCVAAVPWITLVLPQAFHFAG